MVKARTIDCCYQTKIKTKEETFSLVHSMPSQQIFLKWLYFICEISETGEHGVHCCGQK